MPFLKGIKFRWPFLFIGLMLVSWGYQHWRVQSIQADVQKEQIRVAEAAQAQIALDFRDTQQQLISKANRITSNQELVEQLRQFTLSPTEFYREALVYISCRLCPARASVN